MSRTLDSRPADDGFAMPAEWEPHAGCWMAWPERPDNWRLGAEPAQRAFAAVAAAIAPSEPVTIGASARQLGRARELLPADVRVVELATDDAWMRDIGPTFVTDRDHRVRGVDWPFNAWGGLEGGLYAPWDADDRAAAAVLASEGLDRYRAPLVLEGGSIHVDGEGTLLTTEECLLNRNRNPSLGRDEIERHLRDYTGAEKVIWLGAGVFEDETDGHIDNLACFVRPGVVALTWCDDPSDPQHAISLDARRRLEDATDARGRSLEVHLVQQPGPLFMTEAEAAGIAATADAKPRAGGARLAASYVNFYIANDRVVVPRLDERTDDAAAEVIGALFPDRQVVGVATREVLLGGGNIHCITQQIPV
ncbi:MAG: agmatine deiminase [Acidimicrobiales bacterium]